MTNEQRDLEAGYRALAQEWLRDRPHRRGRDHRETRSDTPGRHSVRDGHSVTLTAKSLFEECLAAAAAQPDAVEYYLRRIPEWEVPLDRLEAYLLFDDAAFLLKADK